ncbi:hypothetical protein C8F04DRAFT_1303509 [Mycena alexandri]|uniref:Uncharacterized protein n=1 Tax=Mycena alexandri TaxID=1745969 RepID=A0AAD6WT39_9AGAR|nr:hypothetical protein C8F04DRAFT_1303509 [Mycena alexandri]
MPPTHRARAKALHGPARYRVSLGRKTRWGPARMPVPSHARRAVRGTAYDLAPPPFVRTRSARSSCTQQSHPCSLVRSSQPELGYGGAIPEAPARARYTLFVRCNGLLSTLDATTRGSRGRSRSLCARVCTRVRGTHGRMGASPTENRDEAGMGMGDYVPHHARYTRYTVQVSLRRAHTCPTPEGEATSRQCDRMQDAPAAPMASHPESHIRQTTQYEEEIRRTNHIPPQTPKHAQETPANASSGDTAATPCTRRGVPVVLSVTIVL